MKMLCRFFVPGKPATQGSKRHVGRGRIIDSCKALPQWRKDVARVAAAHHTGPPVTGPVHVVARFYLKRPKAHFRADGELKPGAPLRPGKRPDLTKMFRAVEDAMSGIVYQDDAQVCAQDTLKCYAPTGTDALGQGVSVEVYAEDETETKPTGKTG